MNLFPSNRVLLANKLEVELKYLTFLLKCLHDPDNFQHLLHKIVVRGRKNRVVWRVAPTLKKVHITLLAMLEDVVVSRGTSFAYEKGINVRDAAILVAGYKYIYSLDIKNHFNSIRLKQIKSMLMLHGACDDVAYIIARLVCVDYKFISILAQGSSIAPYIANKVCEAVLDPLVERLLPEGCTVCRYSDNIYIATNSNLPRSFLSTLSSEITKETGWVCHKLRYLPYYRSQKVLGFTLNSRVNIPKKTYENIKARIYNACKNPEVSEKEINSILGIYRYWRPYLSSGRESKLTNLIQNLLPEEV